MAKQLHKPKVPLTRKPAPVKGAALKKPGLLKPFDPKKANRYFVLFFFIWALILYGNTLFNKWAVDDNFVTHNEVVKKGFKAFPEILSTFYVSQTGNIGSLNSEYRPVVKLTFAMEYQLWGEKAPRSHLINILLYFWACTLLFFILRRLLRNYNILFPFLITVIFMAHPVHTEVVASLKNRDELLAFLCGLGGLHFFMKYAETKKIRFTLYAMIVFFVGYMCKSSILPFLLLYPLVLYFFTDLDPKKFIFIILSIAAVTILAYALPRMFLPPPTRMKSVIENPLFTEKNFWLRLGTGMLSLWFYLKILVYPYPLVFYYGYNMIPVTGLGNFWVLLSLAIHLGLFIYALRKFREKHLLSFAILFYMFAIAMYSNILVPVVGIVGERFVFVGSLGFCMALIFILFRIFRTDPKSLTIEFNERAKIIVVIILLLIPATALTINRNRQWRNFFDLYKADIEHLGNSVKANIEYGEFLMNTVYQDPNFQQYGKVNEFKQQVMIYHFKRAIELYPKDYKTLNDLGTVYINFTQKPDSAVYFLRKAIALNPDLQPAWVNLGLYYRKKQNIDSAMYCYERVLQINPKELNAVFKLADLYFDKGNTDKAFQMNEEVIKSNPDLDVPYFNIGFYHLALGDTLSCIKYWEMAAQKRSSYEVLINLSIVLKAKGEIEKANGYYYMAMDEQRRMKNAKGKQ
jgi:protein O-mannosyl-transferase